MIDRQDILELTRRMNISRNCFSRIAGAYIASDGIIDGTFNTNFRKLDVPEQREKIAIAKEVVFADTNRNLKEYRITRDTPKAVPVFNALCELVHCGLKNDGILDLFYESAAKRYKTQEDYCILFFSGSYDIILKASDKSGQLGFDSENTYSFIIAAFCPLYGDYEPGLPECGFLYPAYRNQSGDLNGVDIFQYDLDYPHDELLSILGL